MGRFGASLSRVHRYLPYLTKNGDYGNEPTAWDIVVFLWPGSPDRIDETSSPLWNHVQLWILASWGSSTLKGAKLKSNWDLHSASWEEILVGQNTSLKIIQHICVNTFWPTEIGVPISISSLYTNSSPLWSTFAEEIQLHKYWANICYKYWEFIWKVAADWHAVEAPAYNLLTFIWKFLTFNTKPFNIYLKVRKTLTGISTHCDFTSPGDKSQLWQVGNLNCNISGNLNCDILASRKRSSNFALSCI